jgi:hypothetical protein
MRVLTCVPPCPVLCRYRPGLPLVLCGLSFKVEPGTTKLQHQQVTVELENVCSTVDVFLMLLLHFQVQ